MALPEQPSDAARALRAGLLERLFADNVLDLLLLLAQHANQVGCVRPRVLDLRPAACCF